MDNPIQNIIKDLLLYLPRGSLADINCSNCYKSFQRGRKELTQNLNRNATGLYCCASCNSESKTKLVRCSCSNCGALFSKKQTQLSPTNNFCTKSCAAKYNNKHRKTGIRRSKAELYLSQKLSDLGITHECNKRDLIPSGLEIDIYIPSLNLAIELNGPTHYQPIFGDDKYRDICSKDELKALELNDLKIRLVIINVCQSRFKDTQIVLDQFISNLSDL